MGIKKIKLQVFSKNKKHEKMPKITKSKLLIFLFIDSEYK
jgi:hypothetical protein